MFSEHFRKTRRVAWRGVACRAVESLGPRADAGRLFLHVLQNVNTKIASGSFRLVPALRFIRARVSLCAFIRTRRRERKGFIKKCNAFFKFAANG